MALIMDDSTLTADYVYYRINKDVDSEQRIERLKRERALDKINLIKFIHQTIRETKILPIEIFIVEIYTIAPSYKIGNCLMHDIKEIINRLNRISFNCYYDVSLEFNLFVKINIISINDIIRE
jgi:hypothetical protein